MKPFWLVTAMAVLFSGSLLAAPISVKFDKVAENVYAFVGPMDDRSLENFGLNSNHGLIVTDKGAILIDSGASYTAAKPIAADIHSLTIGASEVTVRYFADAYFLGDVTVYVPKANVVFTGDHVYLDRMIGIHPGWSNPKTWRSAVHELMKAYPTAKVVPGHGYVTDMKKVKQETADYLDYLNDVVGKAAMNMEAIEDVSAKARDLAAFKHLKVYDVLHAKNVNTTFLFYEQGN